MFEDNYGRCTRKYYIKVRLLGTLQTPSARVAPTKCLNMGHSKDCLVASCSEYLPSEVIIMQVISN